MDIRALAIGALFLVAQAARAETPPQNEAAAPVDASSVTAPDTAGIATSLAKDETLRVERIRVTGNTVFDAIALRPIVAPFEHRDLNAEDLEDLRVALTRRYIDAGYINSGAVIENQDIRKGLLVVRIIE